MDQIQVYILKVKEIVISVYKFSTKYFSLEKIRTLFFLKKRTRYYCTRLNRPEKYENREIFRGEDSSVDIKERRRD